LGAAEEQPAPAEPRATIPIAPLSRTNTVDFEKEILPIFKSSCLACHNQTTAKAELVLETPQTILKGSENGAVIVPGKSSESLLLQVASHEKKPRMPPKDNKVNAANLTSDQLGLIKLWIDQGATGEVRGPPPIVWQPLPAGLNPIYAVAVTRDGQFAACGRANQIFIYHLPSGQLVTRLTDPQLIKDGLYDRPGVAHRDLVNSLAFSPDGTLLASGDYRAVKLWRRGGPSQKFKLTLPDSTPIECVAASADGKWIATGHRDGRIQLWDATSGKPAGGLSGHTASVRSLKFSPDGTKLCSSSADKTVRVWTVADAGLFAKADAPAEIDAVAWLAEGKQVAAGSGENFIRIWSLPEAAGGALTAVKELKSHEGAVTSLAAVPSQPTQLLSGSADGSVRLWNIESGEVIRKLDHGGPVTAVAVRTDGKRLASAGQNNVVRLWYAESGEQIAELKGDRYARELVAERERDLNFAKSEVGYRKSTLENAEKTHKEETDRVAKATEGKDGALKKFAEKEKAFKEASAAKGVAEKALADLNAELKRATEAKEAAEAAAKQAEVGAKAAADRAEQVRVNAEKAAQSKAEVDKAAADLAATATKTGGESAAGDAAARAKLFANVQSVADKLSADATALAAMAREFSERVAKEVPLKQQAAKEATAIADKLVAEAPEQRKQLDEKLKGAAKTSEGAEREFKQADAAKSVAEDQLQSAQNLAKKAADEIPLAKAGIETAEAEVKKAESVLEASRKSANESEKPIGALAFSPDSLTLATAGDDQKVHTWSAESGAAVETLQGHAGAVHGLAFLPTGTLATAAEQTGLIWDLAGPWTLERLIGSGDATSPISDRVNALAFSPDGKLLATGSGEPSRGGEIKLWRVESGELAQEIKNPHSDTVLALDFSPDGKFLASGAADKFAKVFDLTTGKLAKSFEGHTHHVLGVSWQRNGRVLASAGADKVIKVWDFLTGEQKKTITGFEKEITSIRFLDASNEAIITTGDSQVRLIRDDGKNDVRTYGGAKDFMQSAAITPDGKVVVGGGQDGVLRVWEGANNEVRRVFEPPHSPASRF